MKSSTLILCITALLLVNCNTKKSSETNKSSDSTDVSKLNDVSGEIKSELKNLLTLSEEMVKKEVSENDNAGGDTKITRLESDSDITYSKNGFYGTIYKKPIVSDFNSDNRKDVLIEIEYNTGQIVDKRYFLFLNSSSGLKYTNGIGFLQSKYKSNPKLYSEYGFSIDHVDGDLLIGKSNYAKPEDAHSCPSYKCIEHYKFNTKTNNFDLVYQSKLIKNKL